MRSQVNRDDRDGRAAENRCNRCRTAVFSDADRERDRCSLSDSRQDRKRDTKSLILVIIRGEHQIHRRAGIHFFQELLLNNIFCP